jgi:hypothetical protein
LERRAFRRSSRWVVSGECEGVVVVLYVASEVDEDWRGMGCIVEVEDSGGGGKQWPRAAEEEGGEATDVVVAVVVVMVVVGGCCSLSLLLMTNRVLFVDERWRDAEMERWRYREIERSRWM